MDWGSKSGVFGMCPVCACIEGGYVGASFISADAIGEFEDCGEAEGEGS